MSQIVKQMSVEEQNAIAAFLARKSPKRVAVGARTMTGRDMREACGYTAEVQVVYLIQMVDECGTPFSESRAANDSQAAEDWARRRFPEAQILGVRPKYTGQE